MVDYSLYLLDCGLEVISASVASGGSARVHKCVVRSESDKYPAPGTVVAVKEYYDALLELPGQLRRIQQEANLGTKIQDENVVKTFCLLPDSSNPRFLVMEWVDGVTLDKWIDSNPEADWSTLQGVALGVTSGVQALHSASVMHRDLKPENIMIRNDGTAIVMDVGVAELTVESAETLHTEVGQFLGSMRYSSPQHILGEPFVLADDIYGVGTILFELFTGKRMFAGMESKAALPVKIAQEGQHVDVMRSDVPGSIKVLLQACLHRDRQRRPKLEEVRDSLQNPAGSEFITKELERQSDEERGFRVLTVENGGATFFADLNGAESEVGEEHKVVRRAKKIHVPSLGREISPEQWIATATLKHVFQNVGYFIVLGRRWEVTRKARSTIFDNPYVSEGQWIEVEKYSDIVQRGDWVLKR